MLGLGKVKQFGQALAHVGKIRSGGRVLRGFDGSFIGNCRRKVLNFFVLHVDDWRLSLIITTWCPSH